MPFLRIVSVSYSMDNDFCKWNEEAKKKATASAKYSVMRRGEVWKHVAWLYDEGRTTLEMS